MADQNPQIDTTFVTEIFSKLINMNKEVTTALYESSKEIQLLTKQVSTPPTNQDIINILSDLQRKLMDTLQKGLETDHEKLFVNNLDSKNSQATIITRIDSLITAIDEFKSRIQYLFTIAMVAWAIIAGILFYLT